MGEDGGVVIGRGSRRLTLIRNETGSSYGDPSRKSVESLEADLVADGLTAHAIVFPEGRKQRLDVFFADLERDWKGWKGERRWEEIESGLSLTCAHDGRGTISVAVEIRRLFGEDWAARANLRVDSGEELSSLVRDLRRLLTPAQ